MTNDHISGNIDANNISGVGIAIGHGASVPIYGDIHYYPITLRAPLRQVFDPLIEDRMRLFGGRGAALTRIAEALQQPTGSVLVVTAPAGFGKTALLAALVSQTPDAFAYHFFTPLYGESSLREDFFLRNVVEQMAQWHGHTEQLPTDLNELRALYQQFFDQSLERTRVLVLDGLDEVSTWGLAPYLSRRLPDGLHLILSVRDVGQDWQRDYQLPADQVTHLPLDGLQRDDVAEVLRAAGGNGAVLADEPALLEQVMQAAAYEDDPTLGADPFYVRLLAEDAATGHITPTTVAQQPRGLDAYLDRWWQAIDQSAERDEVFDLCGYLTVALGPIARADLEAINPGFVDRRRRNYFIKILEHVRRWIIEDAHTGYALVHPRLRQYLHSQVQTEYYQEQLLHYCARWQEHHSRYALGYYVGHLEEVERFDGIVATCKDLLYVSLKCHTFPTGDTEHDLRLAGHYAPNDTQLHQLRLSFTQAAHLLDVCERLNDLKATLYSRLCHIPELEELAQRLEKHIERPYLAPRHPLPDLPHPALVRTFTGHKGSIWGCAITPDGQTIVSASDDKTVKVWDGATGQLRATLVGHTDSVRGCAITPDGQTIVSASDDKTVKVWDATSGYCRLTLTGHTRSINACAITPDGQTIVSASDDKTVKVWDATSGYCRLTLTGHVGPVTACAITPDGHTIISAGADNPTEYMFHAGTDYRFSGTPDRMLKVWDARSGREYRTLQGHTASIMSCAITADGSTIASASEDKTVKVWNARTGHEYRTFEGHSDSLTGCAITSDGSKIISTSKDSSLKLWNIRTTKKHDNSPRKFSGNAFVDGRADGAYVVSIDKRGTPGGGDTFKWRLCLWDTKHGICLDSKKVSATDPDKSDSSVSLQYFRVSPDGCWVITVLLVHWRSPITSAYSPYWHFHFHTNIWRIVRGKLKRHRYSIAVHHDETSHGSKLVIPKMGLMAGARNKDGNVVLHIDGNAIHVESLELNLASTLYVDDKLYSCFMNDDGKMIVVSGESGLYFLSLVGFEDIGKGQTP